MIGAIVGWGILAPGVAAAIFVALGEVFFRCGLRRWRVMEVFALWAAFATAYTGLVRPPSFPPVDATQWLIYLLLAVTLFSLAGFRWEFGRMRPVGRLVLCVGAVFFLLGPRAEFAWTTLETLVHMGAWSLGAFALWSFAAPWSDGVAKVWTGLPMLLVLTGESVTLLMSGSAVLAQLCGASAVALFVQSVLRPGSRCTMPQGVGGPVLWLALMLTLVGHTYAYLSATSLCFIAAALGVVGLWRLPPFRTWSRAQVLALQICLGVVLCVGAIWGVPVDASGYGGPW